MSGLMNQLNLDDSHQRSSMATTPGSYTDDKAPIMPGPGGYSAAGAYGAHPGYVSVNRYFRLSLLESELLL